MYHPFVRSAKPAILPEHMPLLVRTHGDPSVAIDAIRETPALIVAMRLLQAHLPNVLPVDPASMAVATGVLLGSTIVATVAPARRALSIDPVRALRE